MIAPVLPLNCMPATVAEEDLGLVKLNVPRAFLFESESPDFERLILLLPTLYPPLTTLLKF